MLTLIIGGARSGKSRFAQSLASEFSKVAFIATACPEDAEMAARIARHRAERPPSWSTIEEPLEIARAVEQCSAEFDCILLDCLTLWLSRLFQQGVEDVDVQELALQEITCLAPAAGSAHLVLVTNELGSGLVPETSLGRRFRDVHGWVNQEVARAAGRVYHMVAGIPVSIKQPESIRAEVRG